MFLGEFLDVLRAFEDAQGGREALQDRRIYTYINGEREPLQVSLNIIGAGGVIIGGVSYLTSSIKNYEAQMELWLIRFRKPIETAWGELWNSVDRAFGDAYIDEEEYEEAERLIPVSVSIHYDKDYFAYQTYTRREPYRDLDGVELRMGEKGIEMHLAYDRPTVRETIKS